MSLIKEALKREPIKRVRTTLWPGTWSDNDVAYQLSLKADRRLLNQTGVLALLDELVEENIRPSFPDVKDEEIDSSGIVRVIAWNRRSETVPGATPNMGSISVVSEIRIRPNTENAELFIEGQQTEVLGRKQWGSSEILVDAIVRAYKNPLSVVIPTAPTP